MFKLLEPKENDRLSIPVDPFADRHTKEEGLPFWKGTAVGIDITLEQTLQFRVLLNALNDVMKEATRERRRKMERRKPRFI